MKHALSTTTHCFRATKKRHTAYRQRLATSEVDDNHNEEISSIDTAVNLVQSSQNDPALDDLYLDPATTSRPLITADLLRKRLKNRRIGGVEFKAQAHRDKNTEEIVEGSEEESLEGLQSIKNKLRIFTRQTGVIGDADRHMMAYVDFELAKRSTQGLLASTQVQATLQQQQYLPSNSVSNASIPVDQKENEASKSRDKMILRQPVTLGMLQEIDLGDEARERNVKMTEQATRRLDGELTEDEQDTGKFRKRGCKNKLDKDGKTWWERKRRHGDDIKRDQLVDQVLRENRLEIYEEPPVQSLITQTDQAADDRIAEAFRREFMDNVSSRQRKKNSASQASARGQGGKKDEVLKGPKLGGSRSARAAVRETLLKSAKK